MKNRILAWLLCVLMLVGMVPVSAFAASAVATLNGTSYDTIQAAVDAAVAGDNTITLAAGTIKESFSITQKAGINIEIVGDAAGTTLDGGITLNGNSQQNNAEKVTIKNITFNASSTPDGSAYIYIPKSNTGRYSHNLFVDGCTFKYSGTDAVNAIKNSTAGCKNWTITNCTVENTMFAFIQTKSTINLVVTGNKVYSKHGLNLDQTPSATITGNSFDVNGYAVRVGASSGGTYTANIEISNNTLISDISPIIIRGVAKNMVTVEENTVVVPAGVKTVDTSEATDAWVQEKENESLASAVAKVGSVQYVSFTEAVAVANAAGTAVVELLADIELGEKLTITGDVTITGAKTITRAATYTGTLFAVPAGASLTLDGGLAIDGGNNYVFDKTAYNADLTNCVKNDTPVASADNAKWFTPEEGAPVATAYMITTSGTLNLNNVSIKNHYSTNGSGIVSASKGAKVVLDGAQITHNASTSGSGLVVNASAGVWSREDELITVVMNDGTIIDGNHVGGNHGIFKIYMGTYFTMNGGEIKNTTGWNSNGTAIGIYHAVFTMNGGLICSNSSVYGPNNGRNAAIYGHSNHLFTMNGGTVCHNTGRSKAGIDSPYSETGYSGLTVINGGNVADNTILGGWSNADVSGGATLTITGGTFTQDVNKWCAEGFAAAYDEATGKYTVVVHTADQCAPKQMSDADGHWSICQVCGDIVDAKVAHTSGLTYDSTHHWDACTVCDHALGDKEEHDFVKGVCTVCGAEEEGYVAPPAFDYVLFALAARYSQKFDVLVSAENATVSGDLTIKYKRSGTVDIDVADGYQLVDVIANGQSLGAVESVTFKKVMGPQTLVVVTEPIPAETPTEETSVNP